MGDICLTYKVNVLGERQSKWYIGMPLLYLTSFYWTVFSHVRVSENPYSYNFYAVFVVKFE